MHERLLSSSGNCLCISTFNLTAEKCVCIIEEGFKVSHHLMLCSRSERVRNIRVLAWGEVSPGQHEGHSFGIGIGFQRCGETGVKVRRGVARHLHILIAKFG
ncbi:hypothetical protein D3C75_611720 [compost metagenome]